MSLSIELPKFCVNFSKHYFIKLPPPEAILAGGDNLSWKSG